MRAGPVPEIPLPPEEHQQIQPPKRHGSPATEASRQVEGPRPDGGQVPRALFQKPPSVPKVAPPPPDVTPPPPPRALVHRLPVGAVDRPRFGAPIGPRRQGSHTMASQRYKASGSVGEVRAWMARTAGVEVVPVYVADHTLDAEEEHKPVVVILFAGSLGESGETLLGEMMTKRGARVIAIDVLIGGRIHDLLDVTPNAIGWHIRRAAMRGEIHSMHAAIPCETFSVARDDCDMVRSHAEPMGLPGLPPQRAAEVWKSNCLLHFTLDVARDVVASGGEVTIENPSPRSDVLLPHVYWKEKAHHASLFRTQPMLSFRNDTGAVEVTTPLCASGLDMQKYVTVLATRGVAVGLAPLHGIVCTHKGHAEKAYGSTAQGLPAAKLSGRYPYVFCVVLACAHLELGGAPSRGHVRSVTSGGPGSGWVNGEPP